MSKPVERETKRAEAVTFPNSPVNCSLSAINRIAEISRKTKEKDMKTTINKTLLTLALAGATLSLGGCYTIGENKYGSPCVKGYNCADWMVIKHKNKEIKGATVDAIIKFGTPGWENSIKLTARAHGLTEADVRSIFGNKDLVVFHKAGFMYAYNTHDAVMGEGVNVGDVVDVYMTPRPVDSHVVRIVKRASDKSAAREAD